MKKILMSILAMFLPWIVLLMKDNPGGAIVCLFMQATIIGWPFASMWAWKSIKATPKSEKE